MKGSEPLNTEQWHAAIIGGTAHKEIVGRINSGRIKLWCMPIIQNTVPNQSVIELGSRRGELTGIIAKYGRGVTLVDWSSKSLEFSGRVFELTKVSENLVQSHVLKSFLFYANLLIAFGAVVSSNILINMR